MSAKRPKLSRELLQRLLPALRMMARFPTRPAGVVSFETNCERDELDAYLAERGRPKRQDVEAVEAELAGVAEAPEPKPERRAPKGALSAGDRKLAIENRKSEIARPPQFRVVPGGGPDVYGWLEAQKAKPVGRVECFQVEVTPALAASWLQLNHGNRKPSRAKIRRFAAAMAGGRWSLNGETIKFSASGRLLDGQSRLQAVIESGVPVPLEVRAGLPDLCQQSMDTGEARRGTHTLEMLGEKYPGILSPALKLLWLWSKGWLGGIPWGANRVLENQELAPLLAQHPGLRASAGWTVSSGAKVTRYLLASEGAFCHYLFGTVDAKLRDLFFVGLIDGLGLTKLSPAYHLRERLAELRQGEDTLGRRWLRVALTIKAWNCAHARQPCTRLVQADDDAFPDVAGLVAPAKQESEYKVRCRAKRAARRERAA